MQSFTAIAQPNFVYFVSFVVKRFLVKNYGKIFNLA